MELLAAARLARRQAPVLAGVLLHPPRARPLAAAIDHHHHQQKQRQKQQTRRFAAQSVTHGNLLQPRDTNGTSNAREPFAPPPSALLHPQQHARVGGDDDRARSLAAGATNSIAESEILVAGLTAHSTDELKSVLMASGASFEDAQRALDALAFRGAQLREKHYLSLLYKACCEGRYDAVQRVFKAFEAAETSGRVILPPRADRTWNYLSVERLQMYRFVLWSMLDSKKYRQMNAFFRQYVHGQPNKWGHFESDALNFLLRTECTGRFADEQDTVWKQRVDTILRKMELWRFNASYSSSHALFRFLLYHADVFLSQERAAGTTRGGAVPSDTSLTLGDVFIRYFNRYPKALRRDPKRMSIAISAAAAAGQQDVVKSLLRDAETHMIRVDAVSFAHAVECAMSETARMEIVELYVKAKERNAVYTTQNEPASISNYLLLHAVFDGNFRHVMELLHEMQLYNNAASNKTVEKLFQSIAKLRAVLRHEAEDEAEDASVRAAAAARLHECPTIEDLLNDFVNVIPRNTHTITQGVLQSLRGGDVLVALRLVRATVRTTKIVLRREIYAQLAYPLLARGSAQYDELELLELERFYDAQHVREREYLYAQVLNLCESNDDVVAMLACLDRWQLQRHAPLSRRALQRVFDIVSKKLQQLRARDVATLSTTATAAATAQVPAPASYIVEGMELSFRAVLQRYFDIVPLAQGWPIASAIIRSATTGLHADVQLLLQQALAQNLELEPAAYKVALEVLHTQGEHADVRACVRTLESRGALAALVAKYPTLQRIVEQQQE